MPKLIPQHYPLFGYYTTPDEVGDPSAVIGWQKEKSITRAGWDLIPALVPVDCTAFLAPDVFVGYYGPGVTYHLFTSLEQAKAEQQEAEAAREKNREQAKDPFDLDNICACEGELHERHRVRT